VSLTTLNAYQQGGPVLDKLKSLWEGIRGRADDPSLGYIGASMMPGIGEVTDLVEIGAGLQDRSLGRVGLGLAGLMIPFVGAAGLKKIGKIAEEVGGDVKDVDKNMELFRARLRETPKIRRKRITQEMIARVHPEDRMPFASLDIRTARRLAPGPGDLSPAQIEDISKLPRAERMKAGLGYDLDIYHGTTGIEGSYLKVLPEEQANWGRGNLGRGIYAHEDPKVADYFTSEPVRDFMRDSENLKEMYKAGHINLPPETLASIDDIGEASKYWTPSRWSQAEGSQVLPLKARSSRLLDIKRHNTPERIYKEIAEMVEVRDVDRMKSGITRGVSTPRAILTDEEILKRAMPTPFDEMIVELDRGFDPSDPLGQGMYNYGIGGAGEVTGLGELAQELGYEGLQVHPRGGGYTGRNPWLPNEVLIFEPGAGLRSPWARFDPRKLHSKDLLAGIGGLAGARYMSNALREDQRN